MDVHAKYYIEEKARAPRQRAFQKYSSVKRFKDKFERKIFRIQRVKISSFAFPKIVLQNIIQICGLPRETFDEIKLTLAAHKTSIKIGSKMRLAMAVHIMKSVRK
jgi:hypothetical protein